MYSSSYYYFLELHLSDSFSFNQKKQVFSDVDDALNKKREALGNA